MKLNLSVVNVFDLDKSEVSPLGKTICRTKL